jgi:Ca-activated chloride channel family protein
MQARLSHPYIASGQSDLFVTADLKGVDVPGSQRAPVNLAVLIDRSGSMSGQKLQDAKTAARHLVNQLQDTDRLAIIHYGSDVRTFPSTEATPSNRDRMLRYIDNIFDEGGTNIGDGLSAGRDQLLGALHAFKVNRIVLISDGQPTEGMTDPSDLRNVVREIRSNGVSVSAIGVGTDFNEDLMQSFAEIGAGSYAYLRDASQLATIFQRDLQHASTLIARNVQLTFELPSGVELGEVLGYRANRSGQAVMVDLPDFSAGQMERVVVRLVVRAGDVGRAIDVSALKLGYQDLLKGDTAAQADIRLSAMVTAKQEEVAAHQDREATVNATRAQSAANTYEAAESLKRGDRARAVQLIQANQAMFDKAGVVAGPAAVQADQAEQKAMLDDIQAAQSDEEVQHQVKASKRKALIDYGKITSTY